MARSANPIDLYIDKDERFSIAAEARDFFKLLEDPSNMYFKQHADAFIASIALGISHGKYLPNSKKESLMILPVYRAADPMGFFPLLVKALHPELDKKELADRMEDYALGGVQYLKEQYEKLGRIDFDIFKALSQE